MSGLGVTLYAGIASFSGAVLVVLLPLSVYWSRRRNFRYEYDDLYHEIHPNNTDKTDGNQEEQHKSHVHQDDDVLGGGVVWPTWWGGRHTPTTKLHHPRQRHHEETDGGHISPTFTDETAQVSPDPLDAPSHAGHAHDVNHGDTRRTLFTNKDHTAAAAQDLPHPPPTPTGDTSSPPVPPSPPFQFRTGAKRDEMAAIIQGVLKKRQQSNTTEEASGTAALDGQTKPRGRRRRPPQGPNTTTTTRRRRDPTPAPSWSLGQLFGGNGNAAAAATSPGPGRNGITSPLKNPFAASRPYYQRQVSEEGSFVEKTGPMSGEMPFPPPHPPTKWTDNHHLDNDDGDDDGSVNADPRAAGMPRPPSLTSLQSCMQDTTTNQEQQQQEKQQSTKEEVETKVGLPVRHLATPMMLGALYTSITQNLTLYAIARYGDTGTNNEEGNNGYSYPAGAQVAAYALSQCLLHLTISVPTSGFTLAANGFSRAAAPLHGTTNPTSSSTTSMGSPKHCRHGGGGVDETTSSIGGNSSVLTTEQPPAPPVRASMTKAGRYTILAILLNVAYLTFMCSLWGNVMESLVVKLLSSHATTTFETHLGPYHQPMDENALVASLAQVYVQNMIPSLILSLGFLEPLLGLLDVSGHWSFVSFMELIRCMSKVLLVIGVAGRPPSSSSSSSSVALGGGFAGIVGVAKVYGIVDGVVLVVILGISLWRGWLHGFLGGLFSIWSKESKQPAQKLLTVGRRLFIGQLLEFSEVDLMILFAACLGYQQVAAWAILATVWDTLRSIIEVIGDVGSIKLGTYLNRGKVLLGERVANATLLVGCVVAASLSIFLGMVGTYLSSWFAPGAKSFSSSSPSSSYNHGVVKDMIDAVLPFESVAVMVMAVSVLGRALLCALRRRKVAISVARTAVWILCLPISSVLTLKYGYGLEGLMAGVNVGLVVSGFIVSHVLFLTDWDKFRQEDSHLLERKAMTENQEDCALDQNEDDRADHVSVRSWSHPRSARPRPPMTPGSVAQSAITLDSALDGASVGHQSAAERSTATHTADVQQRPATIHESRSSSSSPAKKSVSSASPSKSVASPFSSKAKALPSALKNALTPFTSRSNQKSPSKSPTTFAAPDILEADPQQQHVVSPPRSQNDGTEALVVLHEEKARSTVEEKENNPPNNDSIVPSGAFDNVDAMSAVVKLGDDTNKAKEEENKKQSQGTPTKQSEPVTTLVPVVSPQKKTPQTLKDQKTGATAAAELKTVFSAPPPPPRDNHHSGGSRKSKSKSTKSKRNQQNANNRKKKTEDDSGSEDANPKIPSVPRSCVSPRAKGGDEGEDESELPPPCKKIRGIALHKNNKTLTFSPGGTSRTDDGGSCGSGGMRGSSASLTKGGKSKQAVPPPPPPADKTTASEAVDISFDDSLEPPAVEPYQYDAENDDNLNYEAEGDEVEIYDFADLHGSGGRKPDYDLMKASLTEEQQLVPASMDENKKALSDFHLQNKDQAVITDARSTTRSRKDRRGSEEASVDQHRRALNLDRDNFSIDDEDDEKEARIQSSAALVVAPGGNAQRRGEGYVMGMATPNRAIVKSKQDEVASLWGSKESHEDSEAMVAHSITSISPGKFQRLDEMSDIQNSPAPSNLTNDRSLQTEDLSAHCSIDEEPNILPVTQIEGGQILPSLQPWWATNNNTAAAIAPNGIVENELEDSDSFGD